MGWGRSIAWMVLVVAMASTWSVSGAEAEGPEWLHIGPLRIRDLTPFGIQRLDFLPASALTHRPGAGRSR